MNESLRDPDCKPAPTYEYEIHPLALMFPALEGEAFDAFVEDIAARGLLHPIILYRGKILDGRNRYNAAKAAGHKFTERDFKDLSPSADPEAFVISANMQRRQLTAEQKREFISKQIESKPGASDRALARLCGCDNKTVAKVRKDLSERLEDFQRRWDSLCEAHQQGFVAAKRDELAKLIAA
jgi:ParB-like chromosome segregation protein Spo0J